ncbi:MAG: PDZ domain-containing protein, partial [Muribaculaceae bacterium]|nr:PDZ domain-containing protein [Muribaculaceae bacterium]
MKSIKKLYFLIPLFLAVALALGVWIGYSWLKPSKSDNATNKFHEIMSIVDREYVDVVNTDSILDLALPDLLSYLDPHSIYIPAADFNAVNNQLEGSFSGVGLSFNMLTDTIKVIEVISGGPSEKVGIQPGDRIITIDDSIVAGQKISDDNIISRLRGPKGTKVRLGIERSTAKKLLKFEVTRDEIPMKSIDAAYIIEDGIGYIRVNKFSRTTYNEFITDLN